MKIVCSISGMLMAVMHEGTLNEYYSKDKYADQRTYPNDKNYNLSSAD